MILTLVNELFCLYGSWSLANELLCSYMCELGYTNVDGILSCVWIGYLFRLIFMFELVHLQQMQENVYKTYLGWIWFRLSQFRRRLVK